MESIYSLPVIVSMSEFCTLLINVRKVAVESASWVLVTKNESSAVRSAVPNVSRPL